MLTPTSSNQLSFARRHRRVIAAAAVAVLCAPWPAANATSSTTVPPAPSETIQISGTPEADGTPVTLDASVFKPAGSGPFPAVVLAHGFGGDKTEHAEHARALADQGVLALTYTARGFGQSDGRIHLNDPAFEVADAKAVVDTIAQRGDVIKDAAGDPRVGVAGPSYGGALSLMAAANDPRVDVVAASITWHDLSWALLPQHAAQAGSVSPAGFTPVAGVGPLKQQWISQFFYVTDRPGVRLFDGPPPAAVARTPAPAADPICGRYDVALCQQLQAASKTGVATAELQQVLAQHSPAPLLKNLKAPTLLVQGQADSLFGIHHADATARALLANDVPVSVRWTDGGHDGPATDPQADRDAVTTWLTHYLKAEQPAEAKATEPLPAFSYARAKRRRDGQNTSPGFADITAYVAASSEPQWTSLPWKRPAPQTLLSPPGGKPSSTTVIPGAGFLAGELPTYPLAALPGQTAVFDTAEVPKRLEVVGAPEVSVTVTASEPEVTLFASLWQVQGRTAFQPRPMVAPIKVPVTPGQPTSVRVSLPAAAYTMEQGTVWRVLLSATDTGFANPTAVNRITITPDAAGLRLPVADATTVAAADRDWESIGVGIALGVVLLTIAGYAIQRRYVSSHLPDRADLRDVPLEVSGLVHTYSDGHRAVNNVSWRAERGQVVGLLGPNGAGKTTTMRMLLGLIRPDAGAVHILGEPVRPGAKVLKHVGALVEGPGFLPHLTGRQNLHAYWKATGRPVEEAGFEEALEVAALGGAVDRPVRTYSQGMRQRLGIAQAMLGKPDVLLLDEPTNGLDPPQIAAMRTVLHDYAATGRTVVVSSHLLAEVEMTCTHVVVMHAGQVLLTGSVEELLTNDNVTVIDLAGDVDAEPALAALRGTPGVVAADVTEGELSRFITVEAELPRAVVVRTVVESGVDVNGVAGRRQLEEVFLNVIDKAHDTAGDPKGTSLVQRLRQVRQR